MKKLTALILALIFTFTLTACDNAKISEKTTVYSFSGGNDYFHVSNGVIVLAGDEEIFSGGDLQLTSEVDFSDVISLRTEFYILCDGEEKTVLVSEMHDMTGGSSVSLSGDLGKISGGTVVSYKSGEELDLLNNLYFRLTVTGSDGTGQSYNVQMKVDKV